MSEQVDRFAFDHFLANLLKVESLFSSAKAPCNQAGLTDPCPRKNLDCWSHEIDCINTRFENKENQSKMQFFVRIFLKNYFKVASLFLRDGAANDLALMTNPRLWKNFGSHYQEIVNGIDRLDLIEN